MKDLIKSMIGHTGFELRRLPRPTRSGAGEGLTYYRTKLHDVYLPTAARDDVISAKMRHGEIFEPEVVTAARRYITPGSIALDVGSNFGQMAMLFADAVGAGGKVFAFEAQRSVFDILSKNIAANGKTNVEPQFCAVFNESGRSFHFPEPQFRRFSTFGSYNLPLDALEGPEVFSVKIDDYSFDLPVSFMKVDVQGCDLFAMQGALQTIRRHQMPILFEFEQRFQTEYGTTFQDYVDFVASIGYVFAETVLDINFLIVPAASAR